MKLTGPACTEATSEAEEAGRRERAEDSAGGVRVERRVRRRDGIYQLKKKNTTTERTKRYQIVAMIL